MVEVSERSVVIGVARVVAPFWLVFLLSGELNVLLDDAVRRGFTVVKVGERSVVVRISTIVSPFWFVLLLFSKLNIFLDN